MNAALKIQNFHGADDMFTAYVKVEGVCDWTQVQLAQSDYYGRPTGSVGIFYSKEEARAAARKFAQDKINKAGRVQ